MNVQIFLFLPNKEEREPGRPRGRIASDLEKGARGGGAPLGTCSQSDPRGLCTGWSNQLKRTDPQGAERGTDASRRPSLLLLLFQPRWSCLSHPQCALRCKNTPPDRACTPLLLLDCSNPLATTRVTVFAHAS